MIRAMVDELTTPYVHEIAEAFQSPIAPDLFEQLRRDAPNYLAYVWPVLATSIDTSGFLGSALYMADMAFDACEEVYEPVLSREGFVTAGVTIEALSDVEAVLDVFHYLLPQALLAGAALAEAFERPSVGGQGRPNPRELREREQHHLATKVLLAEPGASVLPQVAELFQAPEAPALYRAMASWPSYLEAAWEELQHLGAYPDFRKRGRGLYYYARSGSRFLSVPLVANAEELRASGVSGAEIEIARGIVDAVVPTMATMLMHCTAMRLALGHVSREVVQTTN
jgi:hypothetical protein